MSARETWSAEELTLLPTTRAALEFASRKHAGQQRGFDGSPFIEHPIEVSRLLHRAGAADHVVAAGLLHDVLEKTDARPAELSRRFGVRVARLVSAVSEDQQIRGYVHRKAALRQQVAMAGPDALTVFAADKISKIRELRAAVAAAARRHEPINSSLVRPRRLIHFRRCLGMLEEGLNSSSLVAELRHELAGFNADLEAYAAPTSAR